MMQTSIRVHSYSGHLNTILGILYLISCSVNWSRIVFTSVNSFQYLQITTYHSANHFSTLYILIRARWLITPVLFTLVTGCTCSLVSGLGLFYSSWCMILTQRIIFMGIKTYFFLSICRLYRGHSVTRMLICSLWDVKCWYWTGYR